VEDATDPRQGGHECRRDFASAKVAGHQHENSRTTGAQCRDLQRAVSQTLILCEDNPTVFRDGPEPNTILFIPLEMFVVDFDRQVSLLQRQL
jgi:hypothetical protein